MWYNITIMKRYCLFIIAAAVFLCGCEQRNNAVDYIYDAYSPLTIVTTVTETPADTYSEYMETYTPPSTTGTDVYYYHASPELEYGMEIAPRPDKPDVFLDGNSPADTAMTMVPAPKAERPFTETASVTTAVPEESQTEDTTTAGTTVSGHGFELPVPDTAHVNSAAADTAPTKFVPTEKSAYTTAE